MTEDAGTNVTAPLDATAETGLQVCDLVVRFGGLVALDGVNVHVPPGRLTGLIGPNGAGKTTMFNACTGLVRPSAGSVRFFGDDVTGLAPPARARRGLGRTFQRMELFDRLSLTENVALAREARLAGGRFFGHLWGRSTESQQVREATETAIELCGLTALAHRPVGVLSTGQRRLVELARALAGDFQLLLLDEPSSGLDAAETTAFGQILTRVVAEHGTGILLVEHDMALVSSVCEYVYVLDFGKLIEQGPIDEVLRSPAVRAAYLGSEVA